MVELSVGEVWGDAWGVYKLLFRRSVTTAAIVFAVVDGLDPLSDTLDRRWASILVGIVSFILGFTGPVLVQGALVEIVRNIHEGRPPTTIPALLRSASRQVRSLLWASIIYGIGVFLGLIALIVPGLLIASQWCLMAPLIMLEGETAGDARERSTDLVRPFTWSVLGIIVATFVVTSAIDTGIPLFLFFRDIGPVANWLVNVAASSLTAPFFAHVLTVIYYRITEPERAVIHPDVRTWRSIWQGA